MFVHPKKGVMLQSDLEVKVTDTESIGQNV